ncbi:MAG: tRNA 4-thiouridine(8) synthase ThiI [Bacilli bacterium]|nr:tRNA 4-thiouridine(8) synthase ThiI [Bacilli bacterium]
MNRVILIKYGELTTKKGNRNFFVQTLYNNVVNKLKNYNVKIKKDRSRMYIYFLDEEIDEINSIISNIFGIHKYHIAYIADSNVEDIFSTSLDILKDCSFKTFKVETKRSNKNFEFESLVFSRMLGGHILKNISDISVDVHNPDVLLKVEIIDNKTYIYTNSYKGIGGYPVGTQPRGLLMLSGGIDSPVAGYLALKRGIKVDAVYFEAIPHTSLDARLKVEKLVKKLTKYANSVNLHIVNFTPIQEEIYKCVDSEYVITIMRRMMYRIMDKLTKKYKGYAIINGESIGQVASQTLVSMNVINSVTSVPVIRPVACLDKLEIIDIAKKIDTYDISILPYEDCCTVFVPKHPVINPVLDLCVEMESRFDYEKMIDDTINSISTIKIDDKEEDFADIL